MRGRRIRVVRIDGTPPRLVPVVHPLRRCPLLLALASRRSALILRPGHRAWGFFDRNSQGIHDKLASTIVVAA